MKRGTLAKRLGFEFMRRYRIPFFNQKGNLVESKKTGLIRTKYMTSIRDFDKWFSTSVNKKAPHANELRQALVASLSAKSSTSEKAALSASAEQVSESSSALDAGRDYHDNNNDLSNN